MYERRLAAVAMRGVQRVGLNEDHALQGSVTLVAKLGRHGEVLGIVPRVDSGDLSAIVPCLEEAIWTAPFSPPDGGGATVTIPITFVRR